MFDTFNVGPNNYNINVENVINKLNQINNNKVKIKFSNIKNSKESKSLKLSTLKSKKIFQYPKKSLNQDLRFLNKWYLNSFSNKNMYDYTIKQIKDYLN